MQTMSLHAAAALLICVASVSSIPLPTGGGTQSYVNDCRGTRKPPAANYNFFALAESNCARVSCLMRCVDGYQYQRRKYTTTIGAYTVQPDPLQCDTRVFEQEYWDLFTCTHNRVNYQLNPGSRTPQRHGVHSHPRIQGHANRGARASTATRPPFHTRPGRNLHVGMRFAQAAVASNDARIRRRPWYPCATQLSTTHHSTRRRPLHHHLHGAKTQTRFRPQPRGLENRSYPIWDRNQQYCIVLERPEICDLACTSGWEADYVDNGMTETLTREYESGTNDQAPFVSYEDSPGAFTAGFSCNVQVVKATGTNGRWSTSRTVPMELLM